MNSPVNHACGLIDLGLGKRGPVFSAIRHSRVCFPTVPSSNPRLCLTSLPAGVVYHVVSVRFPWDFSSSEEKSPMMRFPDP